MKNLQQSIKLLAILCFGVILSGCAAQTQRLSSENRQKYSAVRINEVVEKTPDPWLLAPGGANIGLLFGAVGGLAVSGSIENTRQAFNSFLERNSISIEKIVREEVSLALQESHKFQVASAEEISLPSIKISIQQYGFGVPHLLSSNVVPVLMIRCDMIDNENKIIWTAGERILPSIASPIEPTSWQYLHDDPNVIEDQWRKASKYVVEKIMQEL